MTLLAKLRAIGKNPAFFTSDVPGKRYTIWHLCAFLLGYQTGSKPRREGDDVLDWFNLWVCLRYNVPDADWADELWRQSGRDGEAAFRLFFKLLDEYVNDLERLGSRGIRARFMQMIAERGGSP